MFYTDATISFSLRDSNILEGDPTDVAVIVLQVETPEDLLDRDVMGSVNISDRGMAINDSKCGIKAIV